MPDDITRPVPKFHFSVRLGDDKDVTFQEVTGLQAETRAIEYGHGNSRTFSPIKMAGLSSVGHVTMKKGVFAKDTRLFEWCLDVKSGESSKRDVVEINLLGEDGRPKMTWTLHNVWPTQVTGTALKSGGNEVSVESIEIAFETLEVKTC
jgi:phage tail-like protein